VYYLSNQGTSCIYIQAPAASKGSEISGIHLKGRKDIGVTEPEKAVTETPRPVSKNSYEGFWVQLFVANRGYQD